jgi:hypothetical protein
VNNRQMKLLRAVYREMSGEPQISQMDADDTRADRSPDFQLAMIFGNCGLWRLCMLKGSRAVMFCYMYKAGL